MTSATPDPLRTPQAMGPGHEFDTIRRLTTRWGDLVADIGDDAAVMPPTTKQRVISTDACVDGVHFQRAWVTPREIGLRAGAAALSDLAAMGAAAEFVLVALVVPEAWDSTLGDVADGIGEQVRAAGAHIVGGNISRGHTFGITLTVVGAADRVVPRAGAQVGDLVVVTGQLGGPGSALAAWTGGHEPSEWARRRFVHPTPRLLEGQLLSAGGATAMIDLSDGLAADSRHLGAASGVHLAIDPARLPCGPGVPPEAALVSGEEYELLATIPTHALEGLMARWSAESRVPLTVIGQVVAHHAGENHVAALAGHDHFAPAQRH